MLEIENKKTAEEIIAQNKKVVLVLENIRSAYNVGAVFRTSDGAGCISLILAGYTPTPENPKVAKTGLGAEFSVPWAHIDNINELFPIIDKISMPEYGVETAKNALNIFSEELTFPLILYVGNEVTGLSLDLMTHLDKFLAIPMEGRKSSLNVAEASSIAIYEMYRKLHL